MGEKLNPPQLGSFVEANALLGRVTNARAKRKGTAKAPTEAVKASEPQPQGNGRHRKQTPAQRAASLRNLAKARAARST